MRIVKCKNCGNEFETNAPYAHYCSAQCKIDGVKTKRKEWEQKNPQYYQEYRRNKILQKA